MPILSPVRAFICGCSGYELTPDERDFIKRFNPWGLILFRRNIRDGVQVAQLNASFREIVGRENAPVLIDQEGGRVQRMGPPLWPKYPPGGAFGAIQDAGEGESATFLSARLIAEDLRQVGITVDCLPVLDVRSPGAHDIVGDRAYGTEPGVVSRLGRAAAEGLLAGGVLPVVKHMPGHGRAGADSHLELPIVHASREELERVDFAPFRALNDLPLGMTAHVVYTALDPSGPATTSRKIVQEIMRGVIGFDGLLMSDDLSMKALSGSFGDRARAVFAAGADMALHCNGDLAEALPVAEASPVLEGRALERAEHALGFLSRPIQDIDSVDARAKVQSALAMSA